MIDIFSIEEHKVSRDLSGYITYIYGPGGAGKTTFGAKMPKPLLLAFEKGYNAIGGIKAQDVTTWKDMKMILKQLADPRAKEVYQTVVVDTVDKASAACDKYICGKLGIENLGDGGWSVNGWAKAKREWESVFNDLTMMGYAVVFISHSKDKVFKRKDGSEYNQIIPSCSNAFNEIIRNMADIEGYIDLNGNERNLVLRSSDDSIECKSRFEYIDPVIPFSYDSLVDALNAAIDKVGENVGHEYVTTEREQIKPIEELDFVQYKKDFDELVSKLQVATGKDFATNWAPRIVTITDKHLGKGKRVADLTPSQVEQLALVYEELKQEVGNGI